MVASAAVLMGQLDEYCWGGNMDWSGAGDTSKLDFSCMLEPETHKLLKVLLLINLPPPPPPPPPPRSLR